jgi:peroxiredoxin
MNSRSLLLLVLTLPGLCAAEVKIGQILPDAFMQGLNGHSRKLSDYRGKPLVINVWASWCGPCKQETASLERLAWLELARNFNVIGISTDDDRQRAVNWLDQSHSTISQFIDNQREMENLLDASKIPLTVLVGGDGRVLQKVYGAREWDTPQALQLLRETFAL